MSLKRLRECDESDMGIWANNVCADNFFEEVFTEREAALRILIGAKCKDRDEAAAVVRAWDTVLRLYKTAKEMK